MCMHVCGWLCACEYRYQQGSEKQKIFSGAVVTSICEPLCVVKSYWSKFLAMLLCLYLFTDLLRDTWQVYDDILNVGEMFWYTNTFWNNTTLRLVNMFPSLSQHYLFVWW